MPSLKQKIFLIRLRYRDADTFAKFYDEYVGRIYRFVLFKVSSVQEAEDITSEVFLKAWEYLGKKDIEIKNLNSFIYQIARNLVIDYYRSRARRGTVSIDQRKD